MLVCIQTSSISIMTKPQTTLLHHGGHCDVMTTSCPDTPPSLHQHQEHDHQYHVPFKHCLLATIVATTTAAALPPTTTTPTPARKPGICHESSYSFSPIPIVLLSSVVIQFSSVTVTYEPAYELLVPYVRSCQHTNNHSKFKHNNHDHDLSQHDHATNIASRSI